MDTVYMTWLEMSGNGVPIGTIMIIIKPWKTKQRLTLKDLVRATIPSTLTYLKESSEEALFYVMTPIVRVIGWLQK
jgi:hypothetical protein